ncbi:MAG: YkgJ family cysteine cluster protein [Nanoarchaeota archaeon]|nr:YkgJ family cysteine cluster protein [Nanoarchaeota archaeon]
MESKINRKTPLSEVLELGTTCSACGHCCRHGSGALVRGDLKKIAEKLGMKEDEVKEKYLEEIRKFNTILLKPKLIKSEGKPYGRCVFLTPESKCSIQEVKPLQCAIGNCTEHGEELNLWFTLNYYLNENDPESVRQYAVYLKCGGKTLPGWELENLIADKEKLRKILHYEIMR